MREKVTKTEAEWREQLSPKQYQVIRKKGTERPFTGEYNDSKTAGTYVCAGCGAELFSSDHKFDSGTGWPSYYQPIGDDAVTIEEDHGFGMARTETLCATCDGHLGHVFPDGPAPSGLRYCINSLSLKLIERS